MSGVTPGHALLVLGLVVGFLLGEPAAATFEFNRLSDAPQDVQHLVYLSCLSMVLTALYLARGVD